MTQKSNPQESTPADERANFNPNTITLSTFRTLLARYPGTVEEITRRKLTAKAISASSKGKKKIQNKNTNKNKTKNKNATPPVPRGEDDENNDEKVSDSAREAVENQLNAFLELDEWRYEILPEIVKGRRGSSSPTTSTSATTKKKGYLTKDELVKLMEWKLNHGVFRPMLLGMIKGNQPNTVERATGEAFTLLSLHDHSSELGPEERPFPRTSLDAVTGPLRGVGPATASLVLSVLGSGEGSTTSKEGEGWDCDTPFYSDDVFLWLCLGGDRKWVRGNGELSVKYNLAEYRELWEAVRGLRGRLGAEEVSCAEVEKVALVLRHIEVSGVLGEGGGEGESGAVKEEGNKGEKRKIEEQEEIRDKDKEVKKRRGRNRS